MKIIVCAKQVKFTYTRTGRDPVKNYINPEDSIFRINPWDEAALDIALKLKEKDDSVEVIVLSLGPVIAEKELRRCIAIGADVVCRIDTEEEHDSWSKSVLLAQGIKELKADLILCGKESVDKQNGQIGAFIASHLNLPFVSDVVQVEAGFKSVSADGFKAKALRNAGKGIREEIECPLPAVFTVSQPAVANRLPTYEQKQRAIGSPFKILDLDTGKAVAVNRLIHKNTIPPRPRPKKVPTPDSSLPAFDRINQLLAGSLIEKKGAMLTGDPESQVEGIISYLIENGFLNIEESQNHK